uniref:Uncharacterized protein n=1 Tax=Lepeophtheirus salmonis TaxID=72036 RepID=A0A0K2U9L5_LEPSM
MLMSTLQSPTHCLKKGKIMSYARVLSKREEIVKNALNKIDLSASILWETFVITLKVSESQHAFSNVNMKQLPLYKVAINYGFTEDGVTGAHPNMALDTLAFIPRSLWSFVQAGEIKEMLQNQCNWTLG